MFTRSLWILVLSMCSVSFALGAEPSVIEGAKKEAALVFYTTMDIQNSKPVLDAFTKKYPFIRGDLVRLGGTAMVSRIMTEAQAGAQKFDVAVGISPSYVPMREKNLIAPYLSPEFPSLYDDLYDPKGYWATVYLNTLVLGYNTKILSRNDLPKTYEDLLKPQYKQKFIIDIENHDVFYGLSQEWGQEKGNQLFQRPCQARTGLPARQYQPRQFRQHRRALDDICLCANHRAHEANRRARGLDSVGAGECGTKRVHAIGESGASQCRQVIHRLPGLQRGTGIAERLQTDRAAQRCEA